MEGKMFENIPEMIKKSYIITICISSISLVTGILLQREEIYLGFFMGSLIALLNTYLLILGAYKIIYIKANGKIGGTFEFIKRMIIFCITLLKVTEVILSALILLLMDTIIDMLISKRK